MHPLNIVFSYFCIYISSDLFPLFTKIQLLKKLVSPQQRSCPSGGDDTT